MYELSFPDTLLLIIIFFSLMGGILGILLHKEQVKKQQEFLNALNELRKTVETLSIEVSTLSVEHRLLAQSTKSVFTCLEKVTRTYADIYEPQGFNLSYGITYKHGLVELGNTLKNAKHTIRS